MTSRKINFDKEAILSYFAGANVVSTSWYSGVDLGEKLRLADEKCGQTKCKIIVSGDDDFLTSYFPSRDRWIFFEAGTHKSRVPDINQLGLFSYGRAIYLNDNNIVSGVGRTSKLIETDDTSYTLPKHGLISLNVTGNEQSKKNVHVFDLAIYGLDSNNQNDVGVAAINFGNAHFCSTQDVYFEKISGYATQFGGNPCRFDDPSMCPTVEWQQDGAFLRNFVTEAAIVVVAIINSDGVLVQNNTFYNLGRLQNNGGYGVASPAIDIEPNGSPLERVFRVKILDNEFDLRNRSGILYSGVIDYQITNPVIANGGGEISRNKILGATNGDYRTTVGIGFNGIGINDVLVSDNYVQDMIQTGIVLTGNNVRAYNNTIARAGTAGIDGVGALLARDLSNSVINGTTVFGAASFSYNITELGTNRNNVFEYNDAERIIQQESATISDTTYRNNRAEIILNGTSVNNTLENNGR